MTSLSSHLLVPVKVASWPIAEAATTGNTGFLVENAGVPLGLHHHNSIKPHWSTGPVPIQETGFGNKLATTTKNTVLFRERERDDVRNNGTWGWVPSLSQACKIKPW